MPQANEPILPVEEPFKSMANAAPFFIWIAGTDKSCYFFNAEWLRFTGRTEKDELGAGWKPNVHPDDLQRCMEIYNASYKERKEFKIEYRLRHHSGQYHWLVEKAVPRYTPDGTFAGYIGTCMDIDDILKTQKKSNDFIREEAKETQQSLNEELAASNEELSALNEEMTAVNEELRQSQENLMQINTDLERRVTTRTAELSAARAEAVLERDRVTGFFMQAPAGICVLGGPDLVFEMVNPAYQKLLAGRELMNRPIFEALPELIDQPLHDVLLNVYRNGESYNVNELLIPIAEFEGGPTRNRYFTFNYLPRRDVNHEVDGILVFVFEVTDNVRSRRMVENSENKLRSIVMNAHFGLMLLSGKEWRIETVNQQIADLWDKPLNEIVGKQLMEVLPELEGQPFPDLLREVFRTGVGYGQEEELFYLESEEGPIEKYISFYYDPVFDMLGKVNGIIVSAEDITEKVSSKRLLENSVEEQQAMNEELMASNEEVIAVNEQLAASNEELIRIQHHLETETIEKQEAIDRLKANEENIRNMVRQAPVGMCIVEGNPLFVKEVNDSFSELLGKPVADLKQRPYWEVNAEAAAFYKPITDDVFRSGNTYHANEHEIMLIRNGKDDIVFVDFVYEPMKDQEGKVYAIMIVAMDVTEKVLARRKIERTEENLRMAMEAAGLASYYIDIENRTFHPSGRLKEFFGFEPDDEVPYEAAIGQIHEDYRQAAMDLVEAAITSGVRFDMEYPVIGRNDGRMRWVRGIGTVQVDYSGKKLFTGVLHEITEKKLDEIRKNDFIGMVSHELKTPLTSLTLILQMLDMKLKGHDDEFVPEALGKAASQTRRMNNLINGFLNISRLESSKLLIIKKDFDLIKLLEEAIAEAAITTSIHQLLFNKQGSVMVHADRDKIGSVILNLLNNAIKYSPQGMNIEVDFVVEEKEVTVRVKDTGIGIKPQDREKIFDRYYRVEGNDTKYISGFGIGLYLSAEIITRHEGRIWVEGELGEGSVFLFTLPLIVL